MNWTEDKPTVDGWYWWRRPLLKDDHIAKISSRRVEFVGDKHIYNLDILKGEWFGPILAPASTPPTYAQGQEDTLAALGHVKVPHPRCQARYKEAEQRISDRPCNPSVWCDLPAGHEGPHRHVSGHRSFIMDREHLIEMKPLPDLCAKCGTVWPCQDVQTVLRALPIKEGE